MTITELMAKDTHMAKALRFMQAEHDLTYPEYLDVGETTEALVPGAIEAATWLDARKFEQAVPDMEHYYGWIGHNALEVVARTGDEEVTELISRHVPDGKGTDLDTLLNKIWCMVTD